MVPATAHAKDGHVHDKDLLEVFLVNSSTGSGSSNGALCKLTGLRSSPFNTMNIITMSISLKMKMFIKNSIS